MATGGSPPVSAIVSAHHQSFYVSTARRGVLHRQRRAQKKVVCGRWGGDDDRHGEGSGEEDGLVAAALDRWEAQPHGTGSKN